MHDAYARDAPARSADGASQPAEPGPRLGWQRSGHGAHSTVFLHGWPQTSYAWRRVLPLLDEVCSAVALDLPGVGRSAPQPHAFDKVTMAANVHAALDDLGLGQVFLVGHDMGALVGYAYVRRYPAAVRGFVSVDTALPGIAGWEDVTRSPAYWHLGFHSDSARGRFTAEKLIQGNQREYFRRFIDRFAAHPNAVDDTDIAIYVSGYRDTNRLTAGFKMFRALPLDIADNERATETLDVPILLAFSEFSHATLADTVAQGLRDVGVADVRTTEIPDAGHWPAEEQPAALARAIVEFVESIHPHR
ncbi:alpha/beta hydrolase [Nocardia sp. NPDC004604]|uniref:alpha/beta fold hydrolase n=1 Tax=Nocardia sp. NPDC004604 TaxID=3157013 RepID=UPI0033AAE7D9